MDCSCAIDMDSYDEVIVRKQEIRKARKIHICNECRRKIIKEEYEYQTFIFEGEYDTHKTCTDCISIRDVFFSCGYYYGNILGDMINHIDSCDGNIKSEILDELTDNAKKYVIGLIDGLSEEQIARD